MPRAAREYITLDVSGNYVEDLDRIRTIEQVILTTFGERVAYQILRLSSVDRIEDELRDAESILRVSGGKLPVILVNVTFSNAELGPEDFAPIESQFGLRLVGEKIEWQT